MENKIGQSREAVVRLLKTSVPEDEYFLVAFNDAPWLVSDFTTEPERIERSLRAIKADGWTALLDAVYYSVQKLRHARNPRRALLIVSDGADNNSRYSESETRNLVREADVCIFTIGMLGPVVSRRSMKVLRNLAEETGGQAFLLKRMNELPGAVARISAVLRDQYMLGYSPTNTQYNGRYRKVEVRLTQPQALPPLRASWRTGYYAPGP